MKVEKKITTVTTNDLRELEKQDLSYKGMGFSNNSGRMNPQYPVLWNQGADKATQKRRRRR